MSCPHELYRHVCQERSQKFVLGRYKIYLAWILGYISSITITTLLLLHKKFTWPDVWGGGYILAITGNIHIHIPPSLPRNSDQHRSPWFVCTRLENLLNGVKVSKCHFRKVKDRELPAGAIVQSHSCQCLVKFLHTSNSTGSSLCSQHVDAHISRDSPALGRSTIDAILALRLLSELHSEFNQHLNLHVASNNIKSAFDSVDRSALWKALRSTFFLEYSSPTV